MDPLDLCKAFFDTADDDNDDEDEDALAIATIFALGLEHGKQRRINRRNTHRLYLTRPQLMKNPRLGTPWQVLFESRSDRAFITTMGVDCDTFFKILEDGFSRSWNTTPIPRYDVEKVAVPRIHRRSLDAAGALGLVLHYLNSTMRETSLQQIFAIIPTTVSRYLRFALDILLDVLRRTHAARVAWPQSHDEFTELSDLIVARHSLLEGAFGFIDGLNLPVHTSSDPAIENATYNGWLHAHFVSSVLTFSPKGLIIACRLNAPGSWHDAKVAQGIFDKLRKDTPDGFFLVADTAFPRGARTIEGKIRAPLKQGQRLPSDPVKRAEVERFNRQLLSCRQAAEWGMRTLQGSFGRLRLPLDIGDDKARARLLEICVRLHNVRTTLVGINQIRNTYEPIWKDAEDDNMWDHFGDMLVTEIHAHDRVSRFHSDYSGEVVA
ncbi:hypothetical protein SCHPADRAFT_837453 [Schizopora paradoxa]|uniref:DDE Tnp4 domain-containing protein n=1 Tax=Schizopora paradoxa TaxID=27342 RepID=A0A0H2RBG3_9AGAM|nr:hypothetical protein SCHPADRAFT_837453 [Schizopora paradoxa]